jgi:hypothetical protein
VLLLIGGFVGNGLGGRAGLSLYAGSLSFALVSSFAAVL